MTSELPICEWSGVQRLWCPPECPEHGNSFTMTPAERILTAGMVEPVTSVVRLGALEGLTGRPMPEYKHRTRERRGDHEVVVEDAWQVDRPEHTACTEDHQRPPGAQLCHDCYATLERLLGDVPAIVDELRTARLKIVRFAPRPTPPAVFDEETGELIEESPLPWNEAARNAQEQIADALPEGHGGPVKASRWCLGHMREIDQQAVLPVLAAAMRHAHRVIERPRDVVYLGRCPECTADLYADRGGDVICYASNGDELCPYRATWEEHLATVLSMSEDRLFTVSELVLAMGLERERVKNLTRRMEGTTVQRPHLYRHEIVTQQVTTYRLGDVMAEAVRRGYVEDAKTA